MTTIYDRISDALEPLNVLAFFDKDTPATGEKLPDVFIKYSVPSSTPTQHADDEETTREFMVLVSTYQKGTLLNLPDVPGAMKAAGFTRGDDTQIPFNPDTGHYGLVMEFYYQESEE